MVDREVKIILNVRTFASGNVYLKITVYKGFTVIVCYIRISCRRVKRGELKAECIRVIVNSWDDTFIYGISSEESIGYVTVFYGGKSE